MSISLKTIDHIQICIPKGNEQKAKSFYLTILGFKEIEKPESLQNNGGFWCHTGDIHLHIGVEEMTYERSKRHPAFSVENIDQAREYLKKHDIPIYEETTIPNVERFSIRDPFGNRMEILQKS